MSTVKDKMIEALAIYVAKVRDGEDTFLDDEAIAVRAFDVLAQAAEDNMDEDDFREVVGFLSQPVEDYIEVHEPQPTPQGVKEALLVLAQALGVSL